MLVLRYLHVSSSIHEKIKQTEAELKKSVADKKVRKMNCERSAENDGGSRISKKTYFGVTKYDFLFQGFN